MGMLPVYQFNVQIAGYVIHVETQHIRSKAICRDFLSEGKPVFDISLAQSDIDKAKYSHEAIYGECTLWDGSLETIAFHHRISNVFIDYDVMLMHGAVISTVGWAYLFTAPSGTGKTTHIMKWLERCSSAFVVNGDKPFIKFNDDGTVLACGSPWAGKENMYTNTMVPLKSIVLMERAEDNSIERISFAEAFPKLLEQTYRPEDPDKMRKTLKLMQRLNPAVSFWRFKFNNMKDDCFDVAYNALVGQDS